MRRKTRVIIKKHDIFYGANMKIIKYVGDMIIVQDDLGHVAQPRSVYYFYLTQVELV